MTDFNATDGGGLWPVVQTAEVKSTMDSLMGLLEPVTSREPFMVAGPEGSAKSFVIGHCFAKLGRAVNVAVVHCSANIKPQHVIQKLNQVRGRFTHYTAPWGHPFHFPNSLLIQGLPSCVLIEGSRLASKRVQQACVVPQGHQPSQPRQVRDVYASRLYPATPHLRRILWRQLGVGRPGGSPGKISNVCNVDFHTADVVC